MGGKGGREDRVTRPEGRGEQADLLKRQLLVLGIVTNAEGDYECIKATKGGKVVNEVDELSEDDALSLSDDNLGGIYFAIFLVFLHVGLKVYVVVLVCHADLARQWVPVVLKVVPEAAGAAREDLLEEVHKLIGT